KIVVQLLHQLAFRPDAVEHLQQQDAEQLLRRDRRTAFARVKPRKATVQLSQHIAHKRPDLSQRMVRRHPRLRRNVRKQPTLIRKSPPHASLRRFAIGNLEQYSLSAISALATSRRKIALWDRRSIENRKALPAGLTGGRIDSLDGDGLPTALIA